MMFNKTTYFLTEILICLLMGPVSIAAESRLRLIIETDAGGDPDDEQSLVRLLVYANEFDIEGIIANRPKARDGENTNPVRDGLGIVRAHVNAYGKCCPNLKLHSDGYPEAEQLLARTVAGYDTVDDGVQLIINAVDSNDPRPVWFSNWGTDHGAAESCLKRALDRVLRERGMQVYEKFKKRLMLSSADKFGDHTANLNPPFPFWLDASHPPLDGKRWYHRFSALTASAGSFDIERDVRTGHGTLGQLYPVNTGLKQKEGDTMMFLYLLPTGMNNPLEPSWGSWGGRYGLNNAYPKKAYYWANQTDNWNGSTHRDNTLARWAAALQNDFAARMDYCVADTYAKANHPPIAVLNGDDSKRILDIQARSGETITLSSAGSSDPDGNSMTMNWYVYPEAGTCSTDVQLSSTHGPQTCFVAPALENPQTIHIILEVHDTGTPHLVSYRRAVVTVTP